VQDADLEVDPAEYPLVIGPIVEGRADVVFGSRFQGAAPHRVVYFWHRLGNGLLTLLSNMATDLNLTRRRQKDRLARRPPRHLVHPQIQHLGPQLTGMQPVRPLLVCLAPPGSAGPGKPFGLSAPRLRAEPTPIPPQPHHGYWCTMQ